MCRNRIACIKLRALSKFHPDILTILHNLDGLSQAEHRVSGLSIVFLQPLKHGQECDLILDGFVLKRVHRGGIRMHAQSDRIFNPGQDSSGSKNG